MYYCPPCCKKRWKNRKEIEWQATGEKPTDRPNVALPDIAKLKEGQRADPNLTKLMDSCTPNYRLKDGVLFHYLKSKWKMVIPKTLQHVVLHACHSKPTAGHLGRTKTLQRLDSLHLWWKGISSDVRSYVRACTCKVCRQTKPVFKKATRIYAVDTYRNSLGDGGRGLDGPPTKELWGAWVPFGSSWPLFEIDWSFSTTKGYERQ